MKRFLILLLFILSVHRLSAQAIDLYMDGDGFIRGDAVYATSFSMFNRIHVPKGFELYTGEGTREELQKISDTVYRLNIFDPARSLADSFNLQIRYENRWVSRSYIIRPFRPDFIFRIGFLMDRDKCSQAEMESQIDRGVSVYVRFDLFPSDDLIKWYRIQPTRFQCQLFSGGHKVAEYALHDSNEMKKVWNEVSGLKVDRILIFSIRGAGPLGEVRIPPAEFFISQ